MVEVEAATEVEKAVDPDVLYEAKTSDTSKPIVDATNSEVDVVKFQAYGMIPTEGSELKHRKVKKVTTDEISLVTIQILSNIYIIEPVPKPLVLRGSPLECNIDVQWEMCEGEDILPINSYITSHTVPIKIANLLIGHLMYI